MEKQKTELDLPLPEKQISANSGFPKSLTTVTKFSKALAMILFVALPFIGFYLGYTYAMILNQAAQPPEQVFQKFVVPTPTISPAPVYSSDTSTWKTFEWKSLYYSSAKFSLKYPEDCLLAKAVKVPAGSDQKIISCPQIKVEINPQTSGRDAQVISKENVVLGAYTWDRTTYKFGSEANSLGVSYGLNNNSKYYLMETYYSDFSQNAQQEVESIVETFKLAP